MKSFVKHRNSLQFEVTCGTSVLRMLFSDRRTVEGEKRRKQFFNKLTNSNGSSDIKRFARVSECVLLAAAAAALLRRSCGKRHNT